MMPKLVGGWEPGAQVSCLPKTAPLCFTYYVAVPDLAMKDGNLHAVTEPLLTLVARNDTGGKVKKLLESSKEHPVLLLSASDVTAMTVGFYAYGGSPVKLMRVLASGLLNSQAPLQTPLGAFWVLNMQDFQAMLEKGSVQCQLSNFDMVLATTGHSLPSWKISSMVRKKSIQAGKRKLTQDIASAEAELAKKRRELEQLDAELLILEPGFGASCLASGHSSSQEPHFDDA